MNLPPALKSPLISLTGNRGKMAKSDDDGRMKALAVRSLWEKMEIFTQTQAASRAPRVQTKRANKVEFYYVVFFRAFNCNCCFCAINHLCFIDLGKTKLLSWSWWVSWCRCVRWFFFVCGTVSKEWLNGRKNHRKWFRIPWNFYTEAWEVDCLNRIPRIKSFRFLYTR